MYELFIGIFFSFVLTIISLPILMKMAETNKLFVPKGYRHVHTSNVSALGGIAIFGSSTLSFILFSDLVNYPDYKYILSSGILMFAIGIRDDLYNIKPRLKLIGQITAVTLLVTYAGVRIEFLIHFVDGNIGILLDVLLTIGIMTLIINAYNLIDGIDMLAASIGTVILGTLGIYFLLVNQIDYSLALLTIASSLIAFMFFNYSPAKIFMGDTGTLSIGLIMSISLIKLEEISHIIDTPYTIHSAPGISFALISLISFDLLRVAFIRMRHGKSVFIADKNHIHHILLKLGIQPNIISLLLSSFIILQVIISLIADNFGVHSFLIIAINTLLIITLYAIIYRLLASRSQ